MRLIFSFGLIVLLARPVVAERNEYQVRQENKNYEAWRDKAFGGTASNSSASSYRPNNSSAQSSAKAEAEYAQAATHRYLQQRMKEDAAYNARVAANNARVDELNRRYANRSALNEQALAGVVPAMRLLAEDVLSDPAASERDKQAAAGWMAEAAFRGDPEAIKHGEMVAEARRRARAEAEERANDRANAQLLAQANAGDIRASYAVGWQWYLSTDPKVHLDGLRMLRKGVEANDRATLEFLYRYSGSMAMGEEERDLIYQMAARLGSLPGDPKYAMAAAEIHLQGRLGRKIERNAAMPFLLKAAGEDYADAFIRLGEIHEKGIGGPRDLAAATDWYRKALSHEHPESGRNKDGNQLNLTRILLDPENHPKEHAQELLQLWDDSVLGKYGFTRKTALLAADALASGAIGINDPAREIFYLSRVANDDWTYEDKAEKQRVAERYGTYAMAHADDGLRIVVKEDKAFVIRTATRAQAAALYVYGIYNAPNATRESNLAAAYTLLDIPDAEFKAAGATNPAVHLFYSTGKKYQDATACYQAGRLILMGKGVEPDGATANEILLKAWEYGSAKAALLLGIIQQKKMIPDASDAAANEWIKQGALKNDPDCMRHHALQLLAAQSDDAAVVAAQKRSGIEWLTKAAETGHAAALDDLADAYEQGNGVTVDETKSIALLTKASVAGSGSAKRKLATRMAEGRGVPQDQKAALKLMFEAAQTDHLAAGNLGVVLWRGDWGEKAVEDGLEWMEVALERGYWGAGRNLAKIYHLGLGVDANEEKAHAYLERAGTVGGLEAATAVADMYAAGEIIAKDDEAAARWRTTAAQLRAKL